MLALADARRGRPPGRHRLHGRALRRRAGRRPARGRRWWPASACPSPAPAAEAGARFDLLNLPRPQPPRRGPTSRWPRAATGPAGSAPSRRSGASSGRALDRRRSSPRSTRSKRARRSCSSPRTWPPTGATSVGRDRSCLSSRLWTGWCPGSGCSTSIRPTSPTALIDVICATGVPYFDLSLQHVSKPAAAAHAPVGRRRPLPRAHRRHPGA